jgi:hypothetical protein
MVSLICTCPPKAAELALRSPCSPNLVRLEAERDPARVERLLSIGRDAAGLLKEPLQSTDHGNLLYDEQGLRK